MEIQMMFKVPASFMYGQLMRSAQADIKAHTGREVLPGSLDGFTYQKKWANGMTGKLTITHAIANERYAYELDTDRDHYQVDYQLRDLGDHKTMLHYTETIEGKTAKGKANNRTAGFLLHWQRKHRFKKMSRQMAAQYFS
ncbi:hypothetical protein BVJ53_02070 [Lacticaseibacillus chiayiensis]|uniref:DUF3284 domain-containing protein n=1 Tax=Lacticaseibacillus chiayiensis TaxID=2100821 RepID=A0A4V1P347_9LACO|nr:DUF3284 domain-containing protein [Lacticaseibacillus chiayiensis]QVI34697.1 DUF3284 domain-containing protein [Lacticaseibacillus chiayiensis]RXT29760.1 hypothetical protein BVJ53_02070 [Lacticaseibacillus chiayiensis]RXT58811.1 hypothetical protein CHT97_04165 [Lacticaseibacillus chiayiensis]UYN56447.1 DUF3284 domain-containing protein [Lacticaseibacillus chiayiensis]